VSAFEKLIGRLHNVKVNGDRASAGCPICNSRRGRPIAIKATTDGRVLLHAFCGHSVEEVLGAVGLALRDLFDKPCGEHGPSKHSPWSASQVLELALVEVNVVGLIAADMLNKRSISEVDWQRLAKASGRLLAMAEAVRR
jgi:hypothetical protein